MRPTTEEFDKKSTVCLA